MSFPKAIFSAVFVLQLTKMRSKWLKCEGDAVRSIANCNRSNGAGGKASSAL